MELIIFNLYKSILDGLEMIEEDDDKETVKAWRRNGEFIKYKQYNDVSDAV